MYTIKKLFKIMVEIKASDLFISVGSYPMLRVDGDTLPLEEERIMPPLMNELKNQILNEEQIKKYESESEIDFTYSYPGIGRFRVNFFRQRGSDAFVARQIINEIKTVAELNLPEVIEELSLVKRGLVLVVGATGSGKSTTLAAMVDYRNRSQSGHILTLEDPIEFLHQHNKSIVNQREIGQDSDSYDRALKSALREAPSLLLIGEIRDSETMRAALSFSETGHLVLSTLHANNASQTIERILSFFDSSLQPMIQFQLSQNIKAIIAQRLVPTLEGGVVGALEMLLPTPRIKNIISNGDFHLLRATMEASVNEGLHTFDQYLYKLYQHNVISDETAVQFADRQNDQKMLIRSQEETHITERIELDDIS
ncbi:MAG: PilT/PilU family type 4a pilus ATPase [Candidatus Marinimicrobia bacterium]|jgi:twitching motility protein PilU|nr:PilT/PilU family type 4a pilus ATPase [Candidatus Neomarinimicrobiota bacterium]MBT3634856.1 PilT/PilU family type 4a pilus ATPase [Candidatus Neomarinimicrobiota bacterium]MBT3682782.1 PilT/PilU family type 4a pilus ATPase [Candidatus Neomarinimicrobiota bacterium]MBT3759563.1 PilT/PilU family type 4a pilus ATPase [Candidatus Neomarinimicrobiota bacterium]MBT3894565.1 PilT/PilU family type 4a pilus ATPase [Candidatus Neomarinimicrobiota bacterium]